MAAPLLDFAAGVATWLRPFLNMLHDALSLLYPLLSMFPFTLIFTWAIAYKLYVVYRKEACAMFQHYRAPVAGQPAMDGKPFRNFMERYIKHCYFTMLSCISIVLAATVHLHLEYARSDVQRHLILQILVVVSIIQALSGIVLSLLYMDMLSMVIMSYSRTLIWTEGAIAGSDSSWLNTAVVLAMPATWSAGAIISFAAYRIASGVIWITSLEDIAWTEDDRNHGCMAIAAVLYLVFVLTSTIFSARVFVGLKDYPGPVPAGRL